VVAEPTLAAVPDALDWDVPIHVAMQRIFADIEPIAKTEQNEQQKYSFRGVDTVMNALHEIFNRHHVIPLPRYTMLGSEQRPTRSGGELRFVTLRVRIKCVGPQGDSLTLQTIGEAADTSDKACNQAMQAGLKYALFHTFLIPTGEKDADATTHELGGAIQRENQGQPGRSARPSGRPTGPSPVQPAPGAKKGDRGMITVKQGNALFAISRRLDFELADFLQLMFERDEDHLTLEEAKQLIDDLNSQAIDPVQLLEAAAQ
jgi:hypothetical protein